MARSAADVLVRIPPVSGTILEPDTEVGMRTVSRERLAEVFVEMADTLVDEFDLIEFLQTVTARTAELADVAAVGLLLADHHGQLQFMAASDEATRLLELFQIQHHEGPCLDAFRTRTPVVNADLTQAGDRWPLFAPRATESGFHSVHALPLRLRSDVIGALNLFGTGTTPLAADDIQVVQALADVATIGLLQERAIHRAEILTEQLQGALNSRVVIEQAKGALARIHNVSVDAAFDRLRSYARRNNRKLSDLAHAVITEPDTIPTLTRTDATSDGVAPPA
jgi:transcriptional regulator with GAF, ATPase, and Fis domain